MQQLKSRFTRTITWNKYQSKKSREPQNRYLDFLISPSFQGVNRLFVLSFENEDNRIRHTRYFLSKVKLKDYNVKIGVENIFDQPIMMILKHMRTLEKLLLVKEMITQLVDYWIIIISKKIIR